VAALLNNPSDSEDRKAEYVELGSSASNAVNCLERDESVCAGTDV
jgi:hypothetical protein